MGYVVEASGGEPNVVGALLALAPISAKATPARGAAHLLLAESYEHLGRGKEAESERKKAGQ